MRIELGKVEPTEANHVDWHQVTIVLPSGREVKVYCHAQEGDAEGARRTGDAEIDVDGDPVWCEWEERP